MKNREKKKYQDDFYASVMALTETCRGFSLILMVIDHPSFRLSAPALDSLAWFYLEALTFFLWWAQTFGAHFRWVRSSSLKWIEEVYLFDLDESLL